MVKTSSLLTFVLLLAFGILVILADRAEASTCGWQDIGGGSCSPQWCGGAYGCGSYGTPCYTWSFWGVGQPGEFGSVCADGSASWSGGTSFTCEKYVCTASCGDGTCDSGESCSTCSADCGSCCTPNNYRSCSNNDVYWYDSCGNRGSKSQECGSYGCSGSTCNSPPNPPANVRGSCILGSNSLADVRFSWNPSSGASYYQVRSNWVSEGWTWTPRCDIGWGGDTGDECRDYYLGTSFQDGVPAVVGIVDDQYVFWVHACNSEGCSSASQVSYTCRTPPDFVSYTPDYPGSVQTDQSVTFSADAENIGYTSINGDGGTFYVGFEVDIGRDGNVDVSRTTPPGGYFFTNLFPRRSVTSPSFTFSQSQAGPARVRLCTDVYNQWSEVSESNNCGPWRNFDISCVPTDLTDHTACYAGHSYWYDNCGQRRNMADFCGTGEACAGGQCVCQPVSQASSSCYAGDVYWYNSCGSREGIKEACQGGCSGDRCCTTITRSCLELEEETFNLLHDRKKTSLIDKERSIIEGEFFSCPLDLSDTACCADPDACVYDGNCYAPGQKIDVDGDGVMEVCVS